jgi:hypothetical protein
MPRCGPCFENARVWGELERHLLAGGADSASLSHREHYGTIIAEPSGRPMRRMPKG